MISQRNLYWLLLVPSHQQQLTMENAKVPSRDLEVLSLSCDTIDRPFQHLRVCSRQWLTLYVYSSVTLTKETWECKTEQSNTVMHLVASHLKWGWVLEMVTVGPKVKAVHVASVISLGIIIVCYLLERNLFEWVPNHQNNEYRKCHQGQWLCIVESIFSVFEVICHVECIRYSIVVYLDKQYISVNISLNFYLSDGCASLSLASTWYFHVDNWREGVV